MNTYRTLWQFLFFLPLCSPALLAMETPKPDQPIVDRELANFFFNYTQDQRIVFVNEKIGIKSNPVHEDAQALGQNKQPLTYQSINQQFREKIKFLYNEFNLLKYRHSNEHYLFSENKLRNKPIKDEAQLRFNHSEEFKIFEAWVGAQLLKAKNNHQAQYKQLPLPEDQDEFELARQEASFLHERAETFCDQVKLWRTKAIEEVSAGPKNIAPQPPLNAHKGPMRNNLNSDTRTKPYPQPGRTAPASHSSQFYVYPSS